MAEGSTSSASSSSTTTSVPSLSAVAMPGPSSSSAGSTPPLDIRGLIKEAIREELRSASIETSGSTASVSGLPGLGSPPTASLPSSSSLSFVGLLPSSASTSWSTPAAVVMAGSSSSVALPSATPTPGTVAPTMLGGTPFSLASSFPPIPAKLYSKARSLSFVEMKDLLPDNVAAAEQQSTGAGRSPHDPPRQREVTSIMTWVSAFATYIAMVAEAHPSRVKDMLAYLRLIVREAKRGNRGWISYDRIFRQNAATNPATQWSSLDPSLHSSFCLGNEPPPTVCTFCNELDHRSEDCALAKPSTPTTGSDREKLTSRPSFRQFPRAGSSPARRTNSTKICLSWNSGQCMLPGTCEYLHECHTCHETDHRARDCSLTPADSVFKRAKRPKLSPLASSASKAP